MKDWFFFFCFALLVLGFDVFLIAFVFGQTKIPRKGAIMTKKINDAADRYGVDLNIGSFYCLIFCKCLPCNLVWMYVIDLFYYVLIWVVC